MKSNLDLGLLLVRVVLGAVMLAHGLQKFLGGIPRVQDAFSGMGVPMPETLGVLVPVAETLGGAALILGAAGRIAALGVAAVGLGALFTAHLDAGFFAQDGGFEFVLLIAAVGLGLALTGVGRFSVDAVMRSRRKGGGKGRASA
ncbi:MAG: DoxX family protein [Pseudoclavibacter sp.]|nr:DoxX family protein [Pseudoclavibacter sp.]